MYFNNNIIIFLFNFIQFLQIMDIGFFLLILKIKKI